MKQSSNTLRGGGYQTPDCEAVSLIYSSAVIMTSSTTSSVRSWSDDGDDSVSF